MKLETPLVWTRIGAEAGEPLDKILRRKEQERVNGGGLFYWGVGNTSREIAALLGIAREPVDVVFSLKSTPPQAKDASPDSILRWRAYVDASGNERRLPAHVRVKSRGDRNRHYALVCRSDEPLELSQRFAFDWFAHRNYPSGKRIHGKQVTALVYRVEPDSSPSYPMGFRARLVDWVELAKPEAA
jgi:hypothetical protein